MLGKHRSGFITLLLPCLLAACGPGDISRGKAESILEEAFKGRTFSEQCKAPSWRLKPEFAHINQSGSFCTISKIVVVGIKKTSAAEALVEFRIVETADSATLQSWLDATQKLEARLLNLPIMKVKAECGMSCRGMHVWGFTDPSDGEVFGSSFPADFINSNPPKISMRDIKGTRKLQNLKGRISALLKDGRVETSSQAIFQLYDDGWRLAK